MPLDSDKVRRQLEASPDLPTLPTVATQIVSMANSPKTNAADVGKLIEQDQSLTAKVLRLVNSAYYGFPGQIKSISHAVVIIGFNKVKNVVMTASVFDMSKGRTSNRLDLPRFWQHSLGTAIGAKVAAKALGGGLQPEDAFVAGLVHDLGKLILDQHLSAEYEKVVAAVREKGILLLQAEKEILGIHHAQVGGWIVEKWKLPEPLRHAIIQHHTPSSIRENRELVAAVHLGDILARALGVGNGGDQRMPEIQPAIAQQYNLGGAFLNESLDVMLAELRKAKDFFEMIEA